MPQWLPGNVKGGGFLALYAGEFHKKVDVEAVAARAAVKAVPGGEQVLEGVR